MKQIWKRGFAWLTALALMLSLTPTVFAADDTNLLQDGSFESETIWSDGVWTFKPEDNDWGNVTLSTEDSDATANHTDGGRSLHYWTQSAKTLVASQKVTLPVGKYLLTADIQGAKSTPTLFVDDAATAEVSLTGWGTWDTGTLSFEISEEKTYTVGVKLVCEDDGWGYLDNMVLTKTGETEPEVGYSVKVTPSTASVETGEKFTLTATVTNNGENLDLNSGYYLYWWADSWGNYAPSGGDSADNVTIGNYDSATAKNLSVDVTINTAGTYYIVAQLQDSGWKDLVYTYATITVTDPVPSVDPVEAEIFVPYVAGTTDKDGFIRGADVSSLLSILNSGAHYYDKNGKMLGTAGNVDSQGKAFMKLLKESGVNWVRLRVWNDPYNADKKGYGGGNNDLEAAKTMGKWATDAGLKVLIDFHYSDFWADPGKQQEPKAWSGKSVAEKADLITAFTTDSLNTLLKAGVDVGMVQVGNETNGAFCGESSWTNIATLFKAGSAAVRAVNKDILIALHFTNPETSGRQAGYAKNLSEQGVDYDVFATSYYPYWHGTTANLTSVLKSIANTYDKQVMVAETSWAWTLDDGDGHDNTVRVGENDTGNDYPFSIQGQATEFTTVAQAVKNVGDAGLGLFYWENAWIPVAYAYDQAGNKVESIVTSNRAKWEEFGSGWAASYAGGYDPEDAGKWYGGSAVDNQAMFDFNGKALESLNVFKYMQTGAVAPLSIASADNPAITVYVGDDDPESSVNALLAEKVTVTYNNGDTASLNVKWNSADTTKVNYSLPGTYVINGTVTDTANNLTFAVTCTVTVLWPNLLQNPGFEKGNTGYTVKNWKGKGITNAESTNNHAGSYCLHFYNADAFSNATAEQTVTLQPGTYHFTLYAQGGDMGSNPDTHIYVKFGETELTESFNLDGWANWKTPEIEFVVTEATEVTVGVSVTAGAGAWGSFDDWYLYAEPPCEHSAAVHTAAKDPTCAEAGNIEYWFCSDCGKYFKDSNYEQKITQTDTVIPATGEHKLVEVPYKDSTTTSTGNEQHWKCSICGKLFLDEEGKNETTESDVTIAKKSSGSTGGIGGSTGGSTTPDNPDVSTGTTGQGGSTTETTARPSATVNGNSAKSEVSAAMGDEIVKQAEQNNSDTVVVAPKVNADVTETEVTIPGNTLGQIASKTDADLRVETPAGDVTIPNEALSELSEGVVTVTTRRDKDVVAVEITADSERVESVSGKVIIEAKGDGYGPGTVAVIVHKDGTEEIIPTAFVDSQSGNIIIPVDGSITVKIIDNSQAFDDVDSDAWHHDSVEFIASHGLMIGTSETEFSPETNTTRSMLVTVLYRLAGNPDTGTELFNDVEEGAWYSDAIAWAASNGIVNGYGDGYFGPDDVVTREQMITILYRYAKLISAAKNDGHEEHDFPDSEDVSGYAKDYVSWAVEVGIIKGMDDGRLNPQGTADRAQVAAVFERFCMKFYKYI